MQSNRYSCQNVTKLEFHRQNFETYTNIKFHENPSSESRVPRRRTDGRTDGQTERHDEANSHFAQFCERAKNDNKYVLYKAENDQSIQQIINLQVRDERIMLTCTQLRYLWRAGHFIISVAVMCVNNFTNCHLRNC